MTIYTKPEVARIFCQCHRPIFWFEEWVGYAAQFRFVASQEDLTPVTHCACGFGLTGSLVADLSLHQDIILESIKAAEPEAFDDTRPATEDVIDEDWDNGWDLLLAVAPQEVEEEPVKNPCSFCLREDIEPPCEGEWAHGSYQKAYDWEVSKPLPFRGYVCDMHSQEIEWVSFRWAKKQ